MKVLKYILFIFSFLFLFNIDVNAATGQHLQNPKSATTVSEEDKICVYSQDYSNQKDPYAKNEIGYEIHHKEFLYIVVHFVHKSEDGKNVYELNDLTFSLADERQFNAFLSFDNGKNSVSLLGGESINCSDYYVYIPDPGNSVYENTSIYLTTTPMTYSYKFDKDNTNLLLNSLKKTEAGSSINNCIIGGTSIKMSSFGYHEYYGNSGWEKLIYFNTIDNRKICPADVGSDKCTFTRKNIDIDNFKCEDWQTIRNQHYNTDYDANKECYYFLVAADEQTCVEGSQNEQEGKYVTTYVAYKHANAPAIRIIKKADGSYKAMMKTVKEEKEVVISNINKYKSNFSSSDSKSYPSYINYYKIDKNNEVYKIDTEKDKKASNVYMEVSQIGQIVGLGDSAIMETCEDLLGSEFIKFLKDNVFKIIYIAVPIILVALTSFDFAKVVFIDDKEGINKSFKRFGKRCIAAVVIYLIPTILIFVTNIFQSDKIASCARDFKEIAENNK